MLNHHLVLRSSDQRVENSPRVLDGGRDGWMDGWISGQIYWLT